MAAIPSADPRYKYRDIREPSLTLEQLDKLMSEVTETESIKKLGYFGLAWKIALIIFIVVYLIARQKLIDQQLEYDKQKYDQEQAQDGRDQLAKDPLSGEKRP